MDSPCSRYRGTLHNVCAVHRGMCRTLGDVQYTGGCSVHRGVIMSTVGGYHEYTGGCSVHQGDIMSTPGLTMMSVGDIMSTPGDVQYTGGIP